MRRLLQGAFLAGAATLFLIAQPISEWLVGGWDPGVYMNQGIYSGRHGADPTPLPVLATMVKRDGTLFTRTISGRYEAYPGIPIDAETGAFNFYFYPATPLWIALLYRLGGVPTAFRAMSILGLLSAILLFHGLKRCGWSIGKAGCAALLLLSQPLVLYHMHTPCSEMMELMIVTALLVVLSGGPFVLLFPLITLACLNRPGFIISAGLLGLLLSTGSWPRMDRRASLYAVFAISAGLGCAFLFYHTIGVQSVIKIGRAFAAMQWGAAGCLAMAFGVLLIRYWRWAASLLRTRWCVLAGLGAPVCGFMIAVMMNPRGGRDVFSVAGHLARYTGWPLLVLAGVGLMAWLGRIVRNRETSALDTVLVLCLFICMLPLGYKHIADLYPWATKRFLSALPLLVAVCSTDVLWRVARKGWRGRMIATTLILLALGWNARNTIHAWSHVEYRDLHKTLSALAEHMAADDVVVADHFLWATPLTLCFDRQVLNGECLWADPSPERIPGAHALLSDLHQEGRRILLLTSTKQGVDIFPLFLRSAQTIMLPRDYPHQVIAHHRRSNGFWLRQECPQFLLSEWMPQGENP